MIPRRPCTRLASLAGRIRSAVPKALQHTKSINQSRSVPLRRTISSDTQYTVAHGKALRSSRPGNQIDSLLRSVASTSSSSTSSKVDPTSPALPPGDAWQDELDVKGGLVEFKDANGRRMGILTSSIIHEDKYFLVDETGREVCVSKNNITFDWSSEETLFGFPDLYAIRAHTAQQLSTITAKQVNNLWSEYIDNAGQSVITPSAVAKSLNFTDDRSALYSAYCILRDNPRYFKPIGHSLFVCRSPQLVKQSAPGEEEQQTDEERAFVHALRAQTRKQVPGHVLPPLEHHEIVGAQVDSTLVQQVKIYACTQFHNPSFNARFVVPLGVNSPKQLLELFEKLGHWQPNYDNPVLYRFTDLPSASFSAQVEEIVAQALKNPISHTAERWDLRSLPAFTVDDPSTTDVDDALSYARHPDGSEWVYIHVADPTRYIRPHSELDNIAKTRSTSIYLPERVIPMLPNALVEAASLTPGKENFALTLAARFDARGQISDFRIAPSILENVHKIPYAKVDSILDKSEPSEFLEHFMRLQHFAVLRRGYREAQGATRSTHDSVQLLVDGRQIKMKHSAEKSRDLIAEYMILGGSLAAEFASMKKVPIPFRAQLSARVVAAPANAALSAFMPSLYSAMASPHSSLGLLQYTQATSPIRRYGDLLVHQQLKSALRQEQPPYSAADLVATMSDVTHATMRAKRVEKLSQRYWLLRYLETSANMDRSYEGLVIEVKGFRVNTSSQLAVVYLQEYAMSVSMDLHLTKGVAKGSRLVLRIVNVDALSDLLIMRIQAEI